MIIIERCWAVLRAAEGRAHGSRSHARGIHSGSNTITKGGATGRAMLPFLLSSFSSFFHSSLPFRHPASFAESNNVRSVTRAGRPLSPPKSRNLAIMILIILPIIVSAHVRGNYIPLCEQIVSLDK